MKVQRFNTINTTTKLKVCSYELPVTPDSLFVIDDSNFIPMSEAVKQLGVNSSAQSNTKLLYDFEDGKDTGMKVPFTRTKDCKDIAELSTHIQENIDSMAEQIEMSNQLAATKKDFEDRLNSIKDNSSVTTSSNTPAE